jgi:hypothetical protein
MEISKLVTAENNEAINQILTIAKQDMVLQNAINSLNELKHINKIEFENYGKSYGITQDLLIDIINLQDKLKKARLGKY